jgi:hypothetical protein
MRTPGAAACAPELVRVPNQPLWGCDGFSGRAGILCENLLACVLGGGPQGRCMTSRGPGLPADDPTPCFCGPLDLPTCLGIDGYAGASCASQYSAAAADFPGNIGDQLHDPTTPVGIADNLAACDADQPCSVECGLK